MRTSDPYEEIEVSRTASREVIDAAYRRLARKFHPDSGESPDPDRMVRINRAYQTIKADTGGVVREAAPAPIDRLVEEITNAANAGHWQRVLTLVAEALAIAPTNRRALLYQAEAGLELADLDLAAEVTDELLALAPDDVEALLMAAEVAMAEEDWIHARGLAATVLVLQPDSAEGRMVWDDVQAELSAASEG